MHPQTPEFNLEIELAKVVSAEANISQSPKIQKVPAFLRERREFCKFYQPKLLSIGPIHHHNDNVKVGEQYKHMWTAMYISRVNNEQQLSIETIRDEYKKIKDKIVDVIKRCYSEEYKDKNNNYEALAWMLFVDGCSVLEFMNKASFVEPQALRIKIDQLILMQQDLFLLENQIPFQLLQLLCHHDKNELFQSIHKFLRLHHMVPEKSKGSQPVPIHPQPNHLLDHLRNMILGDDLHPPQEKKNCCIVRMENCFAPKNEKKEEWPRQRNIQELKAAGITVTSLEEENIRNIRFSCHLVFFGRLHLPKVIVDDSTATTYMNLIAYEMCPDFKNDFAISSYVAFLDSLIDHTDDVKELRSAGILHNNLGSDEEVATLFNTITTDLVPDPNAYDDVKKKIGKHCKRRTKTWMAEFTYTHFQSPWSFLALLAAILVVALTCVQTYYTIPHPE